MVESSTAWGLRSPRSFSSKRAGSSTRTWGSTRLPNVQDIPELVTVLVPGATGPTPYSGKAIGEMGNVPVAGAIANAVYDAVGVRITDLPITAEKVYRQMQAQAAR